FLASYALFNILLMSAAPGLRHVWSHVLIGAGIAWLGSGLLRDLLATRDEQRLVVSGVAALRVRRRAVIGPTEVAVALGIVNVLFAAFVVVQIRYLFGGSGLVE